MKIIIKHLFILLFLGLIPCGCDNDPASPAEEHTDTDGFILEDESGIEIYREFEGASTGSVTIGIGQTLALSVHFLNHEGIEIEHEEGEEDHEDELKITVINTDIAIVEVNEHCDEITDQTACETAEHCEWHADEAACEEEEHHGLGIHITGVSAGATTFKLELMHGDHPDYTSTNNVPISVTASN